MSNNTWYSKASCKGQTELFFGSSSEKTADRRKRERQAKQVCRSCPVLSNCLNYIKTNPEYGIWAGMTEEERYTYGYSTVSLSVKRKHLRKFLQQQG